MSKDPKTPHEPFSIGEKLFMTLVNAMIAERYKDRPEHQKRMQEFMNDNMPVILQNGNRSGDLLGELKKFEQHVEALATKKEAEKRMLDEAMGREGFDAAVKEGNLRKAIEEKAFFILRWAELRNLKHPTVQQLIEIAQRTGDKALLIRLGRALQEEPKSIHSVEPDKVRGVMVHWWAKGPDGQMGLSRLTDEALADFLNLALGRNDLTLATIRKIRQRLRLKKGPKPHLTKVQKNGDGIVVT